MPFIVGVKIEINNSKYFFSKMATHNYVNQQIPTSTCHICSQLLDESKRYQLQLRNMINVHEEMLIRTSTAEVALAVSNSRFEKAMIEKEKEISDLKTRMAWDSREFAETLQLVESLTAERDRYLREIAQMRKDICERDKIIRDLTAVSMSHTVSQPILSSSMNQVQFASSPSLSPEFKSIKPILTSVPIPLLSQDVRISSIRLNPNSPAFTPQNKKYE